METPLDEFVEKSGLKEAVLLKEQDKTRTPAETTKSGARMPRQASTQSKETNAPETIAVVDRVAASTFVTPSQRRKAAEAK